MSNQSKKNILFVINNLNAGGAENALVSLLQEFDYSRYEVDLLLMKQHGLFLNKLPGQVNLLPAPEEFLFFDMPIKNALLKSLSSLRLDLFFGRLRYSLFSRNEKIATRREQKLWLCMKKSMPAQKKKYHAAIGYLENIPNCYIVDKTNADIKIGFIRNDYDKLGMDPNYDKQYFKKLTALLTVSESCENILRNHFGDLPIQIGTMQSVFSPNTIKSLAAENVELDFSGNTIISVGRLYPQKGFDLAIDACALLRDKGIDVKWYVIGDGALKEELVQRIKDRELETNFFFIGQRENPYAYLQKATIYAQTSRFEGKSRATEEAKILAKPILVTNFPTVLDQIEHLKTGYIVDLDAESIAKGIVELLNNISLTHQLTNNLKSYIPDNDKELNIMYNILNK
ncbi:MAG TPA: glycosyltransferase [Flavobacterium sp.]|nr:glycosyltransferase [Flavobacterium sp.]